MPYHRNEKEDVLIGQPLVMAPPRPLAMRNVQRVMINGGIRNLLTQKPCHKPIHAAAIITSMIEPTIPRP